jgi:hypothetical protein
VEQLSAAAAEHLRQRDAAPTAANYVAAPSTTPPAASSPPANAYPSVPASLATSTGSYRPGSTAHSPEGVQNAGYTQPAAGNVGGSLNYGNTYYR